MEIKVKLGIGFPSSVHDDVLSIDDDLTEEQICEEVEAWANNYIEISWQKVE